MINSFLILLAVILSHWFLIAQNYLKPNAIPEKCLKPAHNYLVVDNTIEFEVESERVEVRLAYKSYQIVPAQFMTLTEQVLYWFVRPHQQ